MTQVNRARARGVKKQISVTDICYFYYLLRRAGK